MTCPRCSSSRTSQLAEKTSLGYKVFRCLQCKRKFNERTGTPFNFLEFPTDIVLLVVLWRLRYKLSLRDLSEMFLSRGFGFTHEAVRDWEARFAPLITQQLRSRRRGKAGKSWYVDESYVKVGGKVAIPV
jgi:putative transposase